MFAVLGAVLVWKVATAPAEYTGTNSVGVRSIVATLQPGQRMCVPGLSIPRDTGRVRFQLAARSARQRFDGRLTAVGHSYPTTAVVGQPRGALTDLDFAIPTAGAGHSAPATFCFRPVGGSAQR